MGNPHTIRLSLARRLLKRLHPEVIPWPATTLYNLISSTAMFQRHYELVARDISSYCAKGHLLDIGTGPGWLLLKLHQECPAMQLVGLDASPAMVAQGRKNMANAGLADVIKVTEGNASRLPFADGFFDIVVSTGSVHHWKDPITALNDVYRVLKHDSYALMYDLVSDTPAPVLDEVKRQIGWFKTTLFWLHGFEEPFYSRENLEALVQSTLFKEGRSQFVGLLHCMILKKGPASV